MGIIFIVFVIIIPIAYCIYYSVRINKDIELTIEQRRKYVESISSQTRIIVNNGNHLFFIDNQQQKFGIDASGKLYSFAGLFNMNIYKDGISFKHNDSRNLCVGHDSLHPTTTIPLDKNSIARIEKEMLPILRKNLHIELENNGIFPTHEYDHDGEIWGCDVVSKKFYCTYGCFSIFNFSDLQRVTIEDMSDCELYDGKYIIHVILKNKYDWSEEDLQLHFQEKDLTFNNFLAMFKGIRNRQ